MLNHPGPCRKESLKNKQEVSFYKYQVALPDGTMDKCILFRTVIIVPQGMSIPGKNNCL